MILSSTIGGKKLNDRKDLHSSPEKPSAVSRVSNFLTPPRIVHAVDSTKQAWSVSFKGEARSRPVVFSRQLVLGEGPKPLIPGMVDQMAADLNRLKGLLDKYKKKLSKTDRSDLDTRKNKMNREISKLVYQIIFVLNTNQIKEKFPNNEETLFIIKCLNVNTSFIQRLKIISRMDIEELNDPNFVWAALADYEQIKLQIYFEEELRGLNINFKPLVTLHLNLDTRTRVIFTDVERSRAGFKFIKAWMDNFSSPGDDLEDAKIKIKLAGPKKVAEDLHGLGITCADFEMAWGHLMNDRRHLNETIIFATSLQALKDTLKVCAPDSTFVLDAHGGANELSIGQLRFKGIELKKYIRNIVELIGEKITHVILSACATGCLKLEASSIENADVATRQDKFRARDFEMNSTLQLKNRKKILVDQNADVSSMFERLSFENMESFAAYFASLVLNRERQDRERGTAVTVSPSLLFPDSINGGVIGVPASTSDRRDWPDYHKSWEADDRFGNKELSQFAYKSITLYNDENNRKALDGNKWRKNRATF